MLTALFRDTTTGSLSRRPLPRLLDTASSAGRLDRERDRDRRFSRLASSPDQNSADHPKGKGRQIGIFETLLDESNRLGQPPKVVLLPHDL